MFIIRKTDIFEKWFKKLKDIKAKAKILARLKRVELGNLGDCKPVGNKVFELRITYGPGYRIYYTQKDEIIVILLIGGTKGSQQKDIQKSYKMVKEIGE